MNKKLLNILGAAVSLICIALYFFCGYIFKFNYIHLIKATSAGDIIIDDDNDKIRIFKMHGSHADGCIEFDKISKDTTGKARYNLPINICEDNGKIYLINFFNYLNETEQNYEVTELDFSRGKMYTLASFSETGIEYEMNRTLNNENQFSLSDQQIFVKNGVVCFCIYMFALSDEDEAGIFNCTYKDGRIETAEMLSPLIGEENEPLEVFISLGDELLIRNSIGNLYVCGEETRKISDDRFLNQFSLFDNTAVGYNLTRDAFYRIDPQNGVSRCQEIQKYIDDNTLSPVEIRGVCYNGSFVMNCYDGTRGFIFHSISGEQLYSIYTANPGIFFLKALGIAAAAFAAVWIVGLAIYFIGHRGSAAMKFAVMIVPVMLVFNSVVYLIVEQVMNNYNKKMILECLGAVVDQCDTLGIMDGIEDFDFEGEDYLRSYHAAETIYNSLYITYQYQNSINFYISVELYGYSAEYDSFLSVFDMSGGVYDKSIDLLFDSDVATMFYDAISSGERKFCTYYDSSGQSKICLISPTFSDGSKVNGACVLSTSAPETEYRADVLMERLLLYELILSVVISLIFAMLFALTLKGLKNLRKKSADFLSGNYVRELIETKDRKRCYDEITVISERFDELLVSLNRNLDEIENLRTVHRAYFSDMIPEILNKKNILNIDFNEKALINAYCIRAFLPKEYSDFHRMNDLLKALSKSLKKFSAFASNVDNTEIMICSQYPRSINILLFLREYDSNIRAVFDKCYMRIGVMAIGDDSRLNASVFDKERMKILIETFENTEASAVVTESSLSDVSGNLTRLCIGMVDGEHIYELSDSERRKKLMHAAELLKKGVELYFRGDYPEARGMFVMVLKLHQGDPIPIYYINLIDEHLKKGGEGSENKDGGGDYRSGRGDSVNMDNYT